jgi:hypothetical protein
VAVFRIDAAATAAPPGVPDVRAAGAVARALPAPRHARS